MGAEELISQVLLTWRRHNEILLLLLREIPSDGLTVIPPFSRGRMVAEQFAHLDAVRRGWRLALKQTGHRLPERVAMQGLWGTWFYGR